MKLRCLLFGHQLDVVPYYDFRGLENHLIANYISISVEETLHMTEEFSKALIRGNAVWCKRCKKTIESL